MLDSDMLVRQNIDDLFDLDLPNDWIAAAHVCACNPRQLAHYPADWCVNNELFILQDTMNSSTSLTIGSQLIVLIHLFGTLKESQIRR
jgi:alpha-N-acetylglucosamine transferase